MSALIGLTRMFGPRMQDVLDRREEAARLVSMVDDSEELEPTTGAWMPPRTRFARRAGACPQARREAARFSLTR